MRESRGDASAGGASSCSPRSLTGTLTAAPRGSPSDVRRGLLRRRDRRDGGTSGANRADTHIPREASTQATVASTRCELEEARRLLSQLSSTQLTCGKHFAMFCDLLVRQAKDHSHQK